MLSIVWVDAAEVVVNAGSEGKEHFRRPLRKGAKHIPAPPHPYSTWLRHVFLLSFAHPLALSFICCSPLGAGVPAEAESEMVSACVWQESHHVSVFTYCRLASSTGHASRALRTQPRLFSLGFASAFSFVSWALYSAPSKSHSNKDWLCDFDRISSTFSGSRPAIFWAEKIHGYVLFLSS